MENNTEQKEKVFYKDTEVTVTLSRYVADEKTYAMRNISSVSVFIVKASYTLQLIIAIIGAMMLTGDSTRLTGLLVFVFGVFWIVLTKNQYSVRISTNAGETNSLVSNNKAYIQKIVTALNEAIIERG